ncbi:acyltransferase family protein [Humibacter ginsenosidimutans]|uniref:Acetyltransferase n=1 Tax=Humibacter ginsenosidimutans TaxID=2599293 RepID=A0A5B8M2C2_9MICO|nr:acyltransferase family protein [Humibacter ginsenosidimutans]QDZ14797.1 acetyltransferase [Humibacter ginsenosidimutans]
MSAHSYSEVAPLPAPTQGRRHLAGLDGLRALAVLAVIAYHYAPAGMPGGFIGVDVFFVISGFLITGLLVGSIGRREPMGRFWLRRARRLLPALVIVVLVCSTAALFVGGDVLAGIGSQIGGAFTFSSNWVYIALDQSYFTADAPQLFRNLWSLAVEEQFYLLWPLLAVLLLTRMPRRGRAILPIVLAFVSVLLMVVLYPQGGDPSRVYYGTDTHFFGLALGAALALMLDGSARWDPYGTESGGERFTRRWAPAIGVLALALLAVYAVFVPDTSPFNYDGGLLLVSLLAAALVWSVTRSGSVLGRVLDMRPLRAIGVRSYGLYLWHWPVFVLVTAAFAVRTDASPWTVSLIALAISAVATWLSYRFIETPVRTKGFGVLSRPFSGAWRGRPALLAATGAASVLLVVGVVGTSAAAIEGTKGTAAQQQIEAGQRAIEQARRSPPPAPTAPPSGRTGSTPAPLPSKPAPASSPSAAPATVTPPTPRDGSQISAIGDSVMLASAPALVQAFPGIDIDAVVSRSPRDAPGILAQKAKAGTLRSTVIIGLGTNGYLGTGTLDRDLAAVGPDRRIVFVNIYADRPWLGEVDDDLAAFVTAHPNTTALADWHDAIASHVNLLGPDHIHPGGEGGVLYASCVASALDRLR